VGGALVDKEIGALSRRRSSAASSPLWLIVISVVRCSSAWDVTSVPTLLRGWQGSCGSPARYASHPLTASMLALTRFPTQGPFLGCSPYTPRDPPGRLHVYLDTWCLASKDDLDAVGARLRLRALPIDRHWFRTSGSVQFRLRCPNPDPVSFVKRDSAVRLQVGENRQASPRLTGKSPTGANVPDGRGHEETRATKFAGSRRKKGMQQNELRTKREYVESESGKRRGECA
jgi:hypothetical protein